QWRPNRRCPNQQKTSQPINHHGNVRDSSAPGLRVSPRAGQARSEQCAKRQTSSRGPCRVWMRWKRWSQTCSTRPQRSQCSLSTSSTKRWKTVSSGHSGRMETAPSLDERLPHLMLPAPPFLAFIRSVDKKAIAPGAQTVRRARPGPVRDLLGGGHAPAAWVFCHWSVVSQLYVFGERLAATVNLPRRALLPPTR